MFKPKGVMFLTLVIMLMAFSCSGPESDQRLLTAELPLHLEEHLDAATIEGSEVPEDLPPQSSGASMSHSRTGNRPFL